MYQSPISIYETAVQTIMEERENAIFAKVQDALDVHVDKAELIRALQYDRGQYEVGYMDGKAAAAPKWIPVSERLPKEFISVLVHIPEMNPCPPVMEAYRIGDGWVTKMAAFDINCATHWMPLPEPPKEGK